MNNLPTRYFVLITLILTMGLSSCNTRLFYKISSPNPEKKLFGKSPGKRIGSVVRAGIDIKAKIKQDRKDKKTKIKHDKSIVMSQKRSFDIQTREVQARMIQDRKNIKRRDKERMKKLKKKFKKPRL
jgi:hypothetical protein